MIIYKDKITGDEMLSDAFKVKLVDDVYYEVEGKQVTESIEVSDAMIGGNASAEGGDAAGDLNPNAVSGIDIVIRHRLEETPFSKKGFQTYIKDYSKQLLDKLQEEDPERAKAFKKGMPNVVKRILTSFKDWTFYTGESQNPEGMVACLNWRDDENGSTPFMLFFKDALDIEKV